VACVPAIHLRLLCLLRLLHFFLHPQCRQQRLVSVPSGCARWVVWASAPVRQEQQRAACRQAMVGEDSMGVPLRRSIVTHALESGPAGKTCRVEIQITAEQKEIIRRASALLGRSLSDFIAASAIQAAEAAIREHPKIKLTAQDSIVFANAILNPRMPNEALRAVFAQYDLQVLTGFDGGCD
jgi:uncharacterized protein (DUF1778 family)